MLVPEAPCSTQGYLGAQAKLCFAWVQGGYTKTVVLQSTWPWTLSLSQALTASLRPHPHWVGWARKSPKASSQRLPLTGNPPLSLYALAALMQSMRTEPPKQGLIPHASPPVLRSRLKHPPGHTASFLNTELEALPMPDVSRSCLVDNKWGSEH